MRLLLSQPKTLLSISGLRHGETQIPKAANYRISNRSVVLNHQYFHNAEKQTTDRTLREDEDRRSALHFLFIFHRLKFGISQIATRISPGRTGSPLTQ